MTTGRPPMEREKGILEAVGRTFSRKLAVKSTLIILIGALLTSSIVYLSLRRDLGSSYAETYAIMADLRKELFAQSVLIYAIASLFIILGISIISVVYSHRVAGPLYRLGRFVDNIASKDLKGKVKLREHDEIHVVADDLNDIVQTYQVTLVGMEIKLRELRESAPALSDATVSLTEEELREATAKASDKIHDIQEILSVIKS
jgi:methyl-accepting chemotaxis protein